MGKRFIWLLTAIALCMPPSASAADYITWVDFDVPYAALDCALSIDLETWEQEQHLDWITVLALAATRNGSGKLTTQQIRAAAAELKGGKSPAELLGNQYRYYAYYHAAYTAVLGGLVGSYAIQTADGWQPCYGLKAFSPIAAGYGYAHYDDFGNARSYGFQRKHLGNDLMGALGTPIIAVEGGTVEALGWNQYGGWRIGIRSADSKRYYYYAHLRKDTPYAAGLKEGDTVQAGQVIGFMGRTGYSAQENVNNIETVHLHFGLELVFDESQKESNAEIWIDVYNLVRLLERHRSSVAYDETTKTWNRVYPYVDLDQP